MQKKKNTRFKVTDLLVILVCLSGIGLNIVLFWNDLNRTLTKLTEKPIATVSYKYKAAQRKFLNRVLWDRLKQESPVYNGDIIRTADLSEARVTFPDGQFIELFENTLAQIFWNKKETFVDFSGGDISINSHVGKNAVVLSSGNNRVEVSSGGVLNAKTSSAGDALNVALLEGSGSITSSSGGTQTLDAGSALALLEDGTQEAVPMVAVLSPLPGAYVINSTQQSVPVNFLWKTNNFTDKEYVHIEVAEDSAFSRIVYSGAVRDKSQAEISVSSGIYWWRIYPVSENKTENYIENAASGKINVLYTPPPELITPTKSYVYHYRTRIPAVRFLWTAIEYTSAYKLDIADNPQMQNPKISRQLYDSSLVLSGLDAGTWYWKVTPLYPQDYIGTSQASPVSSFIIEQSGSLEPPVLAAPLSGSFVNIAKERADAYFSWKSEAEAVSYTIQISKNENLSNPIIKKDIKENWFLYKINQNVLQEGQYYWGVYQTDAEGNSSPVSAARPFIAVLGEVIHKTLFPPENYIIADSRMPDTRFTWNTNLPFTSRFQVSDQSDFSSLKIDDSVTVSGIQGKVLPVGEYYWRIVTESDDKTITLAAPAKHFSIVPPLPAPVAEIPAVNSRVVVRESVPVEFKWNIIPDAEYYQIKLYKAGGRTEEAIYESQPIIKNYDSVLMDKLPDGAYRWTIQAFVNESLKSTRRSSLLGIYNFNMKKLTSVVLSAPAAGHVFDGLQALRNPGSVKWSSEEEVGNSRFILSKNPNPASGSSVMDIRNPSQTIKLIPLKEGKWYWTIIAATTDGFDISAKSSSWFIVNPVPLLPAPGGRVPPDRYKIGPAELMQSRAITFIWNAVEGANTYIFTLYQEVKSGQNKLIKTAAINETNYVLEDLSILDRGNFIWQVEAISKAENGVIEQRGTVGQNRFSIDIPQVTKPQANEPGILYGN